MKSWKVSAPAAMRSVTTRRSARFSVVSGVLRGGRSSMGNSRIVACRCLDTRGGWEMEPRVKLWLESEGRLALSDYRLRLLELIEERESLADAAGELGLSYRRAWGKIK